MSGEHTYFQAAVPAHHPAQLHLKHTQDFQPCPKGQWPPSKSIFTVGAVG